MFNLSLPLSSKDIHRLKIGDRVLLTGTIVTARDLAHQYLTEKNRPVFRKLLKGTTIYHCGPIVAQKNGVWKFVSAGPTTSMREEPYEAQLIKNYGIRGIIGKGGMGIATQRAFKKYGAVYFHAVGGAGVALAQTVIKVRNVYLLKEFGQPEALWEIQVKDFPVIVTMDAHGNSLHDAILKKSSQKLAKDSAESAEYQ